MNEEAYYQLAQGRLEDYIWKGMTTQIQDYLSTDGPRQFWQLRRQNAWVHRNDEIAGSMMSLALSPEFSELILRWRTGGLAALSETEAFRVRNYEFALLKRLESQLMQWQQGLLSEDFFEAGFKPVVLTRSEGWRELGLIDEQMPFLRQQIEDALSADVSVPT